MNKKKLDKVIVIDIEATCWEGKKPEDQDREIIEVGICELVISDNAPEPGVSESIMVQTNNSRISQYCIDLTTITQSDVDAGVSLAEACKRMNEEFKVATRVWASWGDYDRIQFVSDCEKRGVKYPFGKRHINVRTLFSLKHGLKKEPGMDKALDILGMKLEGTHHRGVDDAKNIAKILATLL